MTRSSRSVGPGTGLKPPAATPAGRLTSPGREPSLRVSERSDPYEREADRVADRVMRMTNRTVMRACSCDDEDVKRDTSAANPVEGGFAVNRSDVTPAGSGRPLDPATRTWAENAFGHDFSSVRIHTGDAGAGAAETIGARAYTLGHDIVFGSGHYQPATTTGQRLLAHELTHVLQHSARVEPVVHRADLASPRMAGNLLFEDVLDNKEVIEFGESGDEVRRIQQMLMDLGFSLSTEGTSGTFNAETKAAVQAFQTREGLDPDGRVGFRTIGALDRQFPTVSLPSTRSQSWTMSCVLDILCPWNRHMVENVLPTFTIKTFDSRTFPTETWDGSKWVAGTFDSGGFLSPSTNTIGLLNTTSCEAFAFTAYHEGWHGMQASSLSTTEDQELDAYRSTEQWSIDIGVPGQTFVDDSTGTSRDLRSSDPDEGQVVDPGAARDLVRQEYGGVSAVAGETVLARVGVSDVRVRRADGTIGVRAAAAGDRVRGTATMTNLQTMNPADWDCP